MSSNKVPRVQAPCIRRACATHMGHMWDERSTVAVCLRTLSRMGSDPLGINICTALPCKNALETARMRHSRMIALLLALLLAFCVFSGCAATAEEQVATVTADFITAMTNMDFISAHACFWPHAGWVKQETFVEQCEYLKESLGIEHISFAEAHTEAQGDATFFSFQLQYQTKEAGTLAYDCSTRVISEGGVGYLEFSWDLLLPDYRPGDRIVRSTTAGQRGEIFTADGEIIAQNSYADTVYVSVSESLDIQEVIFRVSQLLDLSEKEQRQAKNSYDAALERGYGTSVLSAEPRGTLSEETRNALEQIEGVAIDDESLTAQRYYPWAKIYSHLTGYAGAPDEEQAEEIAAGGYSSASIMGKDGLEKSYNTALLAKDGYRIQLTDSDLRVKSTLFEQAAQDGSDLRLTIDSSLQQRAYYLLAQNLEADQTGVVLVLDTGAGAVEASVSYPSYDANTFATGISQEDYEALLEGESNQPLYARATLGLYPPGSVIKPFTAAAALESGTINQNAVFPYTITNNTWTPDLSDWYYPPVTRSTPSDPPLTLTKAIVNSDNIYFAWLGLKMGEETFLDYLKRIGFGEALDYDIATSTSSMLNKDSEMNIKLLSDMAFGHGELLVTPLQVASMYTAFENDGDMLLPYLVRSVVGSDGSVLASNERTVYKEQAIQSSTLSVLNPILRKVVQEGTAKSVQVDGVTIAAKTGTALKGSEKTQEISWIAAWWQGMSEDRLVVVMIEGPRGEGTDKFSIAKALLTPESTEEPDA